MSYVFSVKLKKTNRFKSISCTFHLFFLWRGESAILSYVNFGEGVVNDFTNSYNRGGGEREGVQYGKKFHYEIYGRPRIDILNMGLVWYLKPFIVKEINCLSIYLL
jgi:hypothetical protein